MVKRFLSVLAILALMSQSVVAGSFNLNSKSLASGATFALNPAHLVETVSDFALSLDVPVILGAMTINFDDMFASVFRSSWSRFQNVKTNPKGGLTPTLKSKSKTNPRGGLTPTLKGKKKSFKKFSFNTVLEDMFASVFRSRRNMSSRTMTNPKGGLTPTLKSKSKTNPKGGLTPTLKGKKLKSK